MLSGPCSRRVLFRFHPTNDVMEQCVSSFNERFRSLFVKHRTLGPSNNTCAAPPVTNLTHLTAPYTDLTDGKRGFIGRYR